MKTVSRVNRQAAAWVALVIIVVSAFALKQVRDDHARRQYDRGLYNMCVTTRDNAINLRQFIEGIQANYDKVESLSKEEIAERKAEIEPAKPAIPTCPPIG